LREERVPLPRPAPALPDPALITLATRIQATFRINGLSLADPDTAFAYQVSLDAVRPVLDGALATGLLTDAQHAVLANMLDAAGDVPSIL
jgi:uncharacterized protein involved in outer membrane biogenesis